MSADNDKDNMLDELARFLININDSSNPESLRITLKNDFEKVFNRFVEQYGISIEEATRQLSEVVKARQESLIDIDEHNKNEEKKQREAEALILKDSHGAILDRYASLVDKMLMYGLTPEEQQEINALGEEIDDDNVPTYEAIIANIQKIIDRHEEY